MGSHAGVNTYSVRLAGGRFGFSEHVEDFVQKRRILRLAVSYQEEKQKEDIYTEGKIHTHTHSYTELKQTSM